MSFFIATFLHFPSPRKRGGEGHFVGVVEVGAGRQTAGEAGDGGAGWLQFFGKINGGGFSFGRLVKRQYQFDSLSVCQCIS